MACCGSVALFRGGVAFQMSCLALGWHEERCNPVELH